MLASGQKSRARPAPQHEGHPALEPTVVVGLALRGPEVVGPAHMAHGRRSIRAASTRTRSTWCDVADKG
jgi:hypothetical protein